MVIIVNQYDNCQRTFQEFDMVNIKNGLIY
jgi:hypothetical protein